MKPATSPAMPAPPLPTEKRTRWLTGAIGGFIASLFVLQLFRAATFSLNPDEALHYQIAHQLRLRDVYASNNANAHPPLVILTLYFWSKLGTSEWFLRLVPLCAYAGFLWFSYAWLARLLGPATALAGVAIAGLAPPVFNLAIEIRDYMLLLCWMAAALFAMEKAAETRSWRWVVMSTTALYLAILSNYSALWFAAGFGAYGLCLIIRRSLSSAGVAAWLIGQAGAAGIYAWLYCTQIAHLRNAEIANEARQGWLRHYYCLPGDNRLSYLADNTRGLFQYFFSSRLITMATGVLFVAGVVMLLRSGELRERKHSFIRLLLLAAISWLAVIAAAVAGFYPYGGTRHCMFLLPFIIVAMAIALAALTRQNLLALGGQLIVLMTAWRLTALPDPMALSLEEQSRPRMLAAVRHLRASVPEDGVILTDYQSSLLLLYYYDATRYYPERELPHFWDYDLGRMRVAVVAAALPVWSMSPADLTNALTHLAEEYQLPYHADTWVFSVGRGAGMPTQFKGSGVLELRSFDDRIWIGRVACPGGAARTDDRDPE